MNLFFQLPLLTVDRFLVVPSAEATEVNPVKRAVAAVDSGKVDSLDRRGRRRRRRERATGAW